MNLLTESNMGEVDLPLSGEGLSTDGSAGALAVVAAVDGRERGGELGVLEALWFVVRTKSRQEKALASELGARSIECFLPLVNELKYYGNRSARVMTPLIPGYVFLRGSLEDAYLADRSRRSSQLIRVSDQAKLADEIQNLRLAVERGGKLEPYADLVRGVRVEVRSGPMRGVQGIVDERRGRRLILQVSALGQAVSLEIDGSLLERVA